MQQAGGLAIKRCCRCVLSARAPPLLLSSAAAQTRSNMVPAQQQLQLQQEKEGAR
jgi:hypothetical protein